jgi:hypothetical protein
MIAKSLVKIGYPFSDEESQESSHDTQIIVIMIVINHTLKQSKKFTNAKLNGWFEAPKLPMPQKSI